MFDVIISGYQQLFLYYSLGITVQKLNHVSSAESTKDAPYLFNIVSMFLRPYPCSNEFSLVLLIWLSIISTGSEIVLRTEITVSSSPLFIFTYIRLLFAHLLAASIALSRALPSIETISSLESGISERSLILKSITMFWAVAWEYL